MSLRVKFVLLFCITAFFSFDAFARGVINLDYDYKADFLVYRPSNGTWYGYGTYSGSYFQVQWGLATDKPVAADYDGDGITDVAVFRPETGVWYIRRSIDGQMLARQWGLATDELVPADYDGDGQTDLAVYRYSDGVWYVLTSTSGYNPRYFNTRALLPNNLPYSQAMVPVPADFDKDGKADFAVNYNSSYFIQQSGDGANVRRDSVFCDSGLLTPFDFSGDGTADAGCIVMYPDTLLTWKHKRSQDNQEVNFVWGFAPNNDLPAPDDFDNDGRVDTAVFRNGDWWIFESGSLQTKVFRFGQGGDLPPQWTRLKWRR